MPLPAAAPAPAEAFESVSDSLLDALEERGREPSDFDYRDGRLLGGPPSAQSAPRSAPGASPPSPQEETSGASGDDPFTPDEQTLQALGLVDPPAPSPPGDDGQAGDTLSSPADLAAVAKTLGLDENDLVQEDGQVFVKTKVDGAESRVSAAEMKTGYQLQSHFTRQNEEFLAKQKEWEAKTAEAANLFNQQADIAMSVLGEERARLEQEFTRDWSSLQRDDPAQYAAQMVNYQSRLQQIDQRQQQLAAAVHQRQQQAIGEQRERLVELAKDVDRKLSSELGWSTPDRLKAGKDQLHAYLGNQYGYSPEELGVLVDHRAYVLSEKARKYDELMQKASTLRKQASVPRNPQSRSARAPGPGGRGKRLARAKERLQETHSVDDLADVISALNIA